MSLKNLVKASCRRYIEETPQVKQARIYAEARSTWDQWQQDQEELITLWITEQDQNGNSTLDKDYPQLEPVPAYRLQFGVGGTCTIWLNIAGITTKEEYTTTLARAREEAYQHALATSRYGSTGITTLPGRIEEVVPAGIRDIAARFSR